MKTNNGSRKTDLGQIRIETEFRDSIRGSLNILREIW